MKKILCLAALMLPILVFTQTKPSYYPVHNMGNWCFSNGTDTIMNESMQFDTIHFCSHDYQDYFLAVQSDSVFKLYDVNLKVLLQGNQSRFFSHGNNLLINWKKNWTRFEFSTKKQSSFIADSVIKRNDLFYVFNQNNTGLIKESLFIPAIYKRIVPYYTFSFIEDRNENYLVLSNDKFGLIDPKGKILIKPEASIIEFDDFGIIKYKVDTWKYLCPDGKIVDPAGKEIHFYSSTAYKIYDTNRNKSTFYRNHKAQTSLTVFEDFFPLGKEFTAVRKAGKIGVINSSNKLIIPVIYDQIEEVDNGFFKFLKDGKWGLVDQSNTIHLLARYDNILEVFKTKQGLFYKVALNDNVGIVKIGEVEVIPVKYQQIHNSHNGFITMKNNLLGFYDLNGKKVLDEIFSGHHDDGYILEQAGLLESKGILIFQRNQRYSFVSEQGLKLEIEECKDYQFANEVLKCYFHDRIEVYYFQDGKVSEKSVYPGIQRVSVDGLKLNINAVLDTYEKSYLELNQLTGLYGARNMLKSGMALDPTYKHHDHSLFGSFYEAGTIADTNMRVNINSFPGLKAYDVYNWMDCSNADFSNENVLALERYHTPGNWTESDDVFQLIEGENLNWITDHYEDPLDPQISTSGLLYHENLNSEYQKVFVGNKTKICSYHQSEVSMMDYFNYLNNGRNLWFSSPAMAELIMNPNMGVCFENSEFGIRDKRTYDRKKFKYEVNHLEENHMWNLYYFQKKGETTWNITNDLDFEGELIENIESFTIGDESDEDYMIISQKTKANQIKKTIYTSFFMPLSDVVYDDVIYAGTLGFLVRQGDQYSYVQFEF